MPVKALIKVLQKVPLRQRLTLSFLMLFSSLTEGMGILLLVPLLNAVQSSQHSQNPVIRALLNGLATMGIPPTPLGILITFLGLLLLRNAVLFLRECLSTQVQHQLVDQLRDRCFKALLGVEWLWIAAGRNSDHANLLLTDVNRVGVGVNFGLGLLVTLATMIAYLFAAFTLSWPMTSLALISCGIAVAALSGQRKKAMQLGTDLGRANRAMQANVQESLSGIKLTKILGNEQRHLDLFRQTLAVLRNQQITFMVSNSRSKALYQSIGAILLASYLYLGLSVFRTTIAELLILVLIFGRLIPMFSVAQQQHDCWLHALPALHETERLLHECHTAREPTGDETGEIWPITDSIRLENITIRYPGRDHPALNNISVSFLARTTTAIMGPSGAGKSTLADVLMGLLQTDGGTLWLNDTIISGENRRSWRHSVAYVPQETFLFHDSIRSNLLWASACASDDELSKALQRAAADFVFQLPQGLDTIVGDGGVRLSGGERQRLALARALLKKPSLLILDEATSALDVENETRVRKAIENLHGDLTVVIIGHRLPTLEHADQVLILKNGQIEIQGTWAEVKRQQNEANVAA